MKLLKNKIIVRKIRNIIILLMTMLIMVGVYRNIDRSRAEEVIEIGAIALDSAGYLDEEEFMLEAKEIKDDTYEIKIPESINTKKVNQIVKVSLEEFEKAEKVDAEVKENTENPETSSSEENVKDEDSTVEIIENKIYLTGEEIDSKEINIEVEYDVVITEDTTLYNKILKYEDEENGKQVELKGYLPVDAELQVKELTPEEIAKAFGDRKMQVAYDIKILQKVVTAIPADEADPKAQLQEIIETIEINPEDFGEFCEVSIKDKEIKENSKVLHVKEDKTLEEMTVKETNDGNISFEAEKFSVYGIEEPTVVSEEGETEGESQEENTTEETDVEAVADSGETTSTDNDKPIIEYNTSNIDRENNKVILEVKPEGTSIDLTEEKLSEAEDSVKVKILDKNGNEIVNDATTITKNITINTTANVGGSQTGTLAEITNDDIGEYIDLGLSLVGTETTTDDWRILWVDEEKGQVYAMLDDYLPNNVNGKNYAQLAGLNTQGTYVVNSTVSITDLVTKLQANWTDLATDLGIAGATVAGTPTGDMLQLSYNYKKDPDIVYTDSPGLSGDMWAKTEKENAYGYWLASVCEISDDMVAFVNVEDFTYGRGQVTPGAWYGYDKNGVCPVVCLPANTSTEKVDGIWKLTPTSNNSSTTTYTIELSGFGENEGTTSVIIPANVIKDTEGNGNEETEILVGNPEDTTAFKNSIVDFTKPTIKLQNQSINNEEKYALITLRTEDGFYDFNTVLDKTDIMLYEQNANGGYVELTSIADEKITMESVQNENGYDYIIRIDEFTQDIMLKINIPERKVLDTSENGNEETDIIVDFKKPTITVNTTSCSWRNSAQSVTITAKDNFSVLSTSNSYQYYLSTSSTALTTGNWTGDTWTNYTSGTAISLNPGVSGTYYLFVKKISDKSGNISTSGGTLQTIDGTQYHRFGTYQFDYDKPTWKYSSKDIYYTTANDVGNDNYANRERTVKITFKGTDITTNATSTLTSDNISVLVNGTAVANSNKTLTTTNNTSKEITCTLTITGITGDGTLSVTIPSGSLKDVANNTNVTTSLTTDVNITIDNTSPGLSLAVTSPAAGYYKAGQVITITATYNENVYKEKTSKTLIDTTSEAPAMALTFGGAAPKGTVTCSSVSGKVITYKYTITDGDNGTLVIKSLGTVYDAAGNAISASNVTPSVSIVADTIAPTITVDTTTATWRNSALNVTITAQDTGGSELSTINSYQYYLSNSSIELTTGDWAGDTWTTYTSGTEISLNPGESGTYYLFVKQVSDNAGNISTSEGTLQTIDGTQYHRFGEYQFDYDKPIWTAENINIDKENQVVTVDIIGTDALSGYESDLLEIEDITVIVDGQEENGVKTNLSTGTIQAEGIKYTLTLTELGNQDEKLYIDWNGIRKIEIAKETVTDKAGNTSNEKVLILEESKEQYTPSFTNKEESELSYTTDSKVELSYVLHKNELQAAPYEQGDYRVISTTSKLPAGTKLTLKDYILGKTYYYYVTGESTEYEVEDGRYIYQLSNFTEMGSTDANYEDSNTYYNQENDYTLEKYNLSIDFIESGLNVNRLAQETYLELRDSSGNVKYENGDTTVKYNLYTNKNAIAKETISIPEGQLLEVKETLEIPIEIEASILEQEGTLDTKYHDQIAGISIQIVDSENKRIEPTTFGKFSITTEDGTKTYTKDANGVIRMPIFEGLGSASGEYKLNIKQLKVPTGTYTVQVKLYTADDGKYYGNEVITQQTFNVIFVYTNESTSIGVEAEAKDRVISKSSETKTVNMTINVDEPTIKTNIRVELYKRKPTYSDINDETSYTGTQYDLVDINQYLQEAETLQTPEEQGLLSATDSKEYMITSEVTETTIQFTKQLIDNIATGEYKLVFKAYDENTLVHEVSKTFIVVP